MKHTKKITILHSNDLHGDFLAEQVDEKLVGGVTGGSDPGQDEGHSKRGRI